MPSSPSTSERILVAARRLFNERGYQATSLAEIARSIRISQGNLTYHFATKRELAEALRVETRQAIRERRSTQRELDVVEDYVEHLLFAMELTWSNRFFLLDTALIGGGDDGSPPGELAADFAELRRLLDRLRDAGLLARPEQIDLDRVSRSLWIVSRYWMDHLREMERRSEITWDDQLDGIRHHLALLSPHLTAAAKRRFDAALVDVVDRTVVDDDAD